MIYGKIWLVVKPTVGVPLYLGAVALTSLFVHYQLLNHTSWLPKYYQGAAVAKVADAGMAPTVAMAPTSVTKN
jgi:light-harvesting protein B-800-850 alpha chain